ncbi:TPA: nitroreductase family protein [Candidatus Acetothermia bacterium]|nr:nitroreductase family protein [Candidatus Acetothermia bacterium]
MWFGTGTSTPTGWTSRSRARSPTTGSAGPPRSWGRCFRSLGGSSPRTSWRLLPRNGGGVHEGTPPATPLAGGRTMNEILRAIQSRRSVRGFRSVPVEREKIDAVVEAARWAPSGKNTQPWRFVVVESPGKRAELGKLVTQKDMVRIAPVTVAILRDRAAGYDELKDAQGIGACAQTILLAAHALGLGACWIGRARDKEVEAVLGAREGEELMMLIPIGYPAETPPVPQRRPLSDLVRTI